MLPIGKAYRPFKVLIRFRQNIAVDNHAEEAQFSPMETNDLLRELADALRERLLVIADHQAREQDPGAHLALLQAVSEKINALQSGLPRDIDPQLDHFFKRRSYDKALAFLETQEGQFPGSRD